MKTTPKMLPFALSLLLGACGGGGGATSPSGAAGTAGGAGTTGTAGTSAAAGTSGAAGATGAAGTGAPRAPSTSVEETLDRLGVDRSVGERPGPDGKPLPSTFDPLASKALIKKVPELFMMGLPFVASAGSTTARSGNATFMQLDDRGSADLMARVDPDPAWGLASTAATGIKRAAAAGDVDGDGRDETLVVWWSPADAAHDKEINLSIVEDSKAATPFAVKTAVVALQDAIDGLSIATGDFDGDGQVDAAIGVVTPTQAKVLLARNDQGAFKVDAAATKTLAPAVMVRTGMSLALQAAQVDRDPGAELVVVLNEAFQANGTGSGAARYFVFDDLGAGGKQLASAQVSGPIGQRAPVSAEVAAGDIDGDGLDEIVVGGLTSYLQGCGPVQTAAVALDDAEHAFATLGTTSYDEIWSECDDSSPFHVRWAPVRVLNVDLDDEPEMLIGTRIFDDWKSTQTFTGVRALPQSAFLAKHDQGWLDRTTSAVVTGDFSGDGRDDVMVFSQDRANVSLLENTNPAQQAAGGSLPSLAVTRSLPVKWKGSQSPASVVMVAVNVDSDSMTLRRASLTHKLVFTQPVVIAALAAAPCQEGIGQNTDACVTTYGTATTSTISKEQVLSVSAGISVGIKVTGGELTQSEASVKGTITTTASRSTGTSTSISRSVTFTTGPMEDSVVFSTVPYDQYEYTVLTHPDAKMVGANITVSVPRTPIVLIAERGFYNDAIPADGLKIDEKVFRHTPGDISTYPRQADVLKLKAQNANVLTNGPFWVGPGHATTSFGLDVGREYSQGQSLSLDYTMEVEATVATVMAGFSVGAGVENSLSVTSGSSTSYSGTVGNIAPDKFSDNLYGYGIFTYVQQDADSGQKFEVINFWVEK